MHGVTMKFTGLRCLYVPFKTVFAVLFWSWAMADTDEARDSVQLSNCSLRWSIRI